MDFEEKIFKVPANQNCTGCSVSQNVLKFDQQLTGEERMIPFIFDDFHFCCSRVIGLDMTEKLTKIYPPLPTSVQPISITKTLLIVPT
jgi:hypothetical protein